MGYVVGPFEHGKVGKMEASDWFISWSWLFKEGNVGEVKDGDWFVS